MPAAVWRSCVRDMAGRRPSWRSDSTSPCRTCSASSRGGRTSRSRRSRGSRTSSTAASENSSTRLLRRRRQDRAVHASNALPPKRGSHVLRSVDEHRSRRSADRADVETVTCDSASQPLAGVDDEARDARGRAPESNATSARPRPARGTCGPLRLRAMWERKVLANHARGAFSLSLLGLARWLGPPKAPIGVGRGPSKARELRAKEASPGLSAGVRRSPARTTYRRGPLRRAGARWKALGDLSSSANALRRPTFALALGRSYSTIHARVLRASASAFFGGAGTRGGRAGAGAWWP
jgi:hypothetical protein